jgi:hypothetical protein
MVAIIYEDDIDDFMGKTPRQWQMHKFSDQWVILTEK